MRSKTLPTTPRDTVDRSSSRPFWRSVSFAVFSGDYGSFRRTKPQVSNLVHSWNIDFIVTTGDNNYTGNTDGIRRRIGRQRPH